jgi:hypothetical protein
LWLPVLLLELYNKTINKVFFLIISPKVPNLAVGTARAKKKFYGEAWK